MGALELGGAAQPPPRLLPSAEGGATAEKAAAHRPMSKVYNMNKGSFSAPGGSKLASAQAARTAAGSSVAKLLQRGHNKVKRPAALTCRGAGAGRCTAAAADAARGRGVLAPLRPAAQPAGAAQRCRRRQRGWHWPRSAAFRVPYRTRSARCYFRGCSHAWKGVGARMSRGLFAITDRAQGGRAQRAAPQPRAYQQEFAK